MSLDEACDVMKRGGKVTLKGDKASWYQMDNGNVRLICHGDVLDESCVNLFRVIHLFDGEGWEEV